MTCPLPHGRTLVPTDDDRQLASEIEDALRALGIARHRKHGEDRPVAPFVRELRGGDHRRPSEDIEASAGEADHPC